jgi:BMFP domain-containing protein YqiC
MHHHPKNLLGICEYSYTQYLMQKNNPFFDDMARMATAAGSTLLEWRREAERLAQEAAEKMATKMQLISREEFEVVREMASKARAENEVLTQRIAALEAQLQIESASSAASKSTKKSK